MELKKILIVIITYNPEIHFLAKNLKKYNDTDILIIDNLSKNVDEIKKILNNTVKGIFNNQNLGIAEALNQGLRYATENNYEYILTMDQDSSFANDYFRLEEGFNHDKNVAIVCPSVIDVNSNNKDLAIKTFDEVFMAITSGCLCDVKALNSVGGFNPKLFIDYVDFEICLKLNLKKYKILRSKEVILNHSLGESKIYHFLGIKFISTNHNSLRRYYNARNRVYLFKKYLDKYPKYFLKNNISFLKTILIIILFEENKIKKLKSILRGIKHGIKL